MDYLHGMNRQQIDNAKAVACFQQAALHGYAVADGYLACFHFWGNAGLTQDEAKAAEMAKKAWPKMVDAAERGDAAAQFVTGLCHCWGIGVPVNNEEAFQWYSKSAAQGDAGGQYMLGACHEYGQGVPMNKSTALKYYRLAAQQGNAGARSTVEQLEKDGVK
jgi:TPR repeat protein